MADQLEVAVLGTGFIGAAMARNLCRTGHAVRVWNRTRAKAEPLAADGARITDDAADAVRGADVVLTTLFDGPAVHETMAAAAPGLRPGTVWLQVSTVSPAELPPLAELAAAHGLVLLDSPVLGTRGPAEQGKLVVLVAGPEGALETVASVLDAVGQRTVRVGDDAASGAATRLKLVCNSWVLALTHGTAEALALADGLGVDPRGFLDAVAGGGLDCGYLRVKSAAILDDDYTPSFALTTAAKDARLIVAAGEAAGVRLDVAEAGAGRFARAQEQGHGAKDMAATYFASFDA